MKRDILLLLMLLLSLTCGIANSHVQKKDTVQKTKISLQKRIPSDFESGAYIITNEIQEWDPKETAIIISDMWNQHWCKGATDRVTEMVPFMNNVLSKARDKGVLIVHAPSDCMGYYKNHPARKRGVKYKSKKAGRIISDSKLDSEKDAVWPIDQPDGGCDCTPECKIDNPQIKYCPQIDLLEVKDQDAISDSGVEIAGLFEKIGIKNVILAGVHTNICVIGRTFGLRNMIRLGYNVVLMRDLTDSMYDSKQWPQVSHFTGNSLIAEYIETYVCPTMVSSDFTGQKQFRFKNDNRPIVAFIIAENEYYANQTLPEFAHALLLKKDVNCEFALGKDEYKEPNLHNIENLQILNDADLAVIYVRRRALPSEQMTLLKEYINDGKPVLGLRTTSHAFDAKNVVPHTGGGLVTVKGKIPKLLDQWPEFDKDVLGGNYQGHYGEMKEGIVFSVVPGMENHPLFRGVSPDNFIGPVARYHTLYENRPLRSENAQVILIGTLPDKPAEPVLWINNREQGKVIYTSLGHWDDWKIEKFRQIMFNAVDYLLEK